MDLETINIIKLLSVKGIGQAKILSMINNLDEHLNQYERAGKVDQEKSERIIKECESSNIEIIAFTDRRYPKNLIQTKDFPPILYCRGNTDVLNSRKIISIVGTRNASDYGKKAARKIAYNLSCEGFVIVSGLALGIDREAHLGSLEGGTPGISVLASGPEKASPSSNSDIYERILSTGGIVISEHEPGFPVIKTELVKRNRIQSGISQKSIIVESGATGGTITQAMFAKKQGRPILTMLQNENSPSSIECDYSGSNRLVSEFDAKGFASWEELVNLIVSDEEILNTIL